MAAKRAAKAKTKAPETKSFISADRAAKYHVSDTRTASGKRKSVDCNDTVAKSLRGKSVADLKKIAKENGLSDRFDATWSKLNEGLCRMALGNALRHLKSGGARKAPAKKRGA